MAHLRLPDVFDAHGRAGVHPSVVEVVGRGGRRRHGRHRRQRLLLQRRHPGRGCGGPHGVVHVVQGRLLDTEHHRERQAGRPSDVYLVGRSFAGGVSPPQGLVGVGWLA